MNEKIICRFDNKNDLDDFCSRNNVLLDENVIYYNFKTKEIKRKSRPSQKRITPKQSWEEHWIGMPEYISEKQEVYAKIEFAFEDDLELAKYSLDQNITDKTKSVWFPKLKSGQHSHWRVIGSNHEAKYPIYVVSKGRHDKCYTSKFLSNMEQKHYVVVEPSEYDLYLEENSNDYCTILKLDMKYKDEYDTFDDLGDTKSKGPGAARNFCWQHSIDNGYRYHWVMDDNTNEGFFYMWRNKKIKSRTPAIFKCCEDFVERYCNIGIAGLNYSKFCKESDKTPAYVLNTRIYSFLLIRNDLPFRWRGRYNEDTDLSLRVLKEGWCTIQFNAFLAGKATTQKIKGGNTDEFYETEGTLPKSKMLEEMHPDVAKVVWKFNRWHHQVDYSGFTQELEPIINDSRKFEKIDYYDMKIIETNETSTDDKKSFLENKYSDAIIINK